MRNFLYNKSDILIAVIIIAVAAVIIWTRVDAIMNTGDKDGGNTSVATEESEETDAPPAPDAPEGEQPVSDGAVSTEGETPVEGEAPPEGEAPAQGETPEVEAPVDDEPVEFTIEAGSAASTVASDLESSGLVESAQAFLDELKAQDKETQLKAGTFEIAPGSSVADIVRKVTNT
jgi:hypothetical protein